MLFSPFVNILSYGVFFFLLSELCWALLICFELVGIDYRKEFVNFQKDIQRPCAVQICFDVIGPASANKYTPNLSLCPAHCLVPIAS